LYSIKEVYCELQKNNLDYILRNITQNLVVVITRHQNTYDYNQFIGYPFPIHGKTYSGCLEKWINEIEGSENIYIKMFFRGDLLRLKQKEYCYNFLKKYGKVTWNDYEGFNLYAQMKERCISNNINKILHVDPYVYTGDSVLGLTFADYTLDYLNRDKCIVFSKAYKHVSCFYESYNYSIELVDNTIEENDLIICPDLLDNHFGKTLQIISKLKKGCIALIVARNMFIEKTEDGFSVYNLTRNDVLLLNSNIFDYMNECVSPFFKINVNNRRYTNIKAGKSNRFLINPFGSSSEKCISLDFVGTLINNLLASDDTIVYIALGSGNDYEREWIKSFSILQKSDIESGRIVLLHDKGFADLLNQLLELNVGLAITPDTGLAHILTRSGVNNITVYYDKFWDNDSLQSLSAESPIGFCSYKKNQIPVVIKEDDILNNYVSDFMKLCKYIQNRDSLEFEDKNKLSFEKYKRMFSNKNQLYKLDFDLFSEECQELLNAYDMGWLLSLYNPFMYCKNICKFGDDSNSLIYSAFSISGLNKIFG